MTQAHFALHFFYETYEGEEISEIRYFTVDKDAISNWSYDAKKDDWSAEYSAVIDEANGKFGDHDDTDVDHDDDWKLTVLRLSVNETEPDQWDDLTNWWHAKMTAIGVSPGPIKTMPSSDESVSYE